MDFVAEGTRYGLLYGQRGQGTGRMPGFGDNPDDPDDLDDDLPGDGMFTDEMICSVAKYEASLGEDSEPITARLRRARRGARTPPPGRRRGRGERVTMVHLLAGIAWDPQIRGFLAVLVGVVVLMGSVYLLLGTNLGARLGFLVALSAIFGWCTLMGVTWWVYGTIGMLGETPHWEVEEVVYQPGGTAEDGLALADLEKAHELDTSALPPPEELQELDRRRARASSRSKWRTTSVRWVILPESNPAFGEAKATVDEHFVELPDEELGLEGAADYVTVYSFETGGKEDLPDDPSRWDRINHKVKSTLTFQHPPRYAIIQVQPVVEQETVPGAAPPTPDGRRGAAGGVGDHEPRPRRRPHAGCRPHDRLRAAVPA